MKWETIRNMGFATTMKAGFSYLKAMVAKRPETNLENFYINRFGKVLYSMFFEGYTEKLWGRHPSEIAADWGAQRVKGLSILSLLKNMLPKGKNAEVETSMIEQFWYPKFGPGQLWETLAADVQAQGAKLQFGHSVKRIVCEGGRVKAVVCDTPQGEQTLEGDIFISSMPVKDLVLGMEAAAPARIRELAAGLPLSDASYWMSFTFINLFGYIGVALAFYKTAFKENKAKVRATLIPLTFTVIVASITEPFDFLFCFAAPLLFVVFSVISGLSMVALKLLNLPVATSGGIISAILGNLVGSYAVPHWYLMFVVGAVVIVVTYFSFVFLIKKFNLKTPGREAVSDDGADTAAISAKAPAAETKKEAASGDVPVATIIEGLGGKDNILSVDNCFTRLRVSLKDVSLLKDDVINTTGCSGIVKKGNDIQIIYGMQVGAVKKAVEENLDL